MKRTVKYYKRRKGGKVYHYPWLGYHFRNSKGNPDFCRELNLSDMPAEQVDAIEKALKCSGDIAGNSQEIRFMDSVSIGAEWTALRLAEQLGISEELEKHLPEKHRQAALCMILDRVVSPKPCSKSALHQTLPGSGMERVVAPDGLQPQEHDFYTGLEKLHAAQSAIQRGLFRRRQKPERMFLYDITSSYVEGEHCPIADFGYNRDGKKGKMQIVVGLVTDSEGLPVAVEVFDGNTSDQDTVMDQIEKMRNELGIKEMVFIGDRGMLTSARRADLDEKEYEKVKYISALTRREIFQLIDEQDHPMQLGLFDSNNLVELEQNGVRYVLCRNPEKEGEDKATRRALLAKTEEKLEMIRRNVEAGRWKKADVIASRLYRWVNHWGMERFFRYSYGEGSFEYERNEEEIRKYDALNGCYVLVSDTVPEALSAQQIRDRYKSLAMVEKAFKAMKNDELCIRPLRHYNPKRVKGHVFVCMLAYMIVWKARNVFQPWLPVQSEQEDSGTSPEQDTPQASLRVVWNRLSNAKIGKIRIDRKINEQLKPLSNDLKSLLKAASASLTGKALNKLGL